MVLSRHIHGRTSSWPKREGSQVASRNSDRTTRSNLRLWCLLLLSRTTISSATIQVAWAEDRALLGSNPSAVPGAKIGGRGDDLSPHPLRLSEIGTQAINPTSIPYLSSPFAELTHPIRGRRNMSFFSLTCATRLSPVCASRPLGRLRIPAAA